MAKAAEDALAQIRAKKRADPPPNARLRDAVAAMAKKAIAPIPRHEAKLAEVRRVPRCGTRFAGFASRGGGHGGDVHATQQPSHRPTPATPTIARPRRVATPGNICQGGGPRIGRGKGGGV